jgi:SAM-dependent MidA family methyltransferase
VRNSTPPRPHILLLLAEKPLVFYTIGKVDATRTSSRQSGGLERVIADEALYPKKISFQRFMELALYHPELGYYEQAADLSSGKSGDYYTSTHVHRAFGEVIANLVVKAHDVLSAGKFSVVEVGSGAGYLAFDVLGALRRHPSVYEHLRYMLLERSRKSAGLSRSLLKPYEDKVSLIQDVEALLRDGVEGVILSNELFDSLPFHRVRMRGGRLREIFVTYREGKFEEIEDEPSTPWLEAYFRGRGIELMDGQEAEVNLEAQRTMERLASALRRGFVLTIDYGFLARELFSPKRMKGTWRCIRRHTLTTSPYEDIGRQDITAHVDFSSLIDAGSRGGLVALRYTHQGQFLVDWGVLEVLERYAGDAFLGEEERQRHIAAIKTLFMPEFMGGSFKVLLQAKNLGKEAEDFYPPSPVRLFFGDTP